MNSNQHDEQKQDEGNPDIQEDLWIVGLFHGFNKEIVLENVQNEEQARKLYEDHHDRSKVLWKVEGINPPERKLRACFTAPWDTEGLGVAALLLVLERSHKPKEMDVRAALALGTIPFVPPSRSTWMQLSAKAAMRALFGRSTVEFFGAAPLRYKSRCYFENVRHSAEQGRPKYVALTIDDAPCRFMDNDSSELDQVRQILKDYDAKATFMIVGSWCKEGYREGLISLLRDGHEFGNHCMMDRSYEFDDDFGTAVDQCSDVICDLQRAAGVCTEDEVGVKWFRAPHGRYTQSMADALHQRNLTNVMCDTYASCPIVQDADFIANHLVQTCQDGSIILLHMPERYVRNWCLPALRGLLEGLKAHDYKVTTLSELSKLNDELGNQEMPVKSCPSRQWIPEGMTQSSESW